MRFARWVFGLAGVYGLLVLLPFYFLEERVGIDDPPPLNHPEHYYGFVGVAAAWQVVYLIIAGDPARYRVFMLTGVLAKSSWGLATVVLFAQGRASANVLAAGCSDLAWCVLFLVAYGLTGGAGDGRADAAA